MADGATIRLNTDNRELLNGLQQAQRAVQEFGEKVDKSLRTLSNLGKFTAGSLGFDYAYEMMKGFVETARESDAITMRFNQTMHNMGDEVKLTASNFTRLKADMLEGTTATTDEIMQATQSMMSFGTIQNEVLTDAVKTSKDLAVMMGTTLPQAAREYGMALAYPERAARILRMAHIQVTEAQREQIKYLMEANDILGAQQVVSGIVSTGTRGMAAREKSSFGGQFAEFKRSMNESAIEMGHAIMEVIMPFKPAITAAAGAITDVAKTFSGVIDYFKQVVQYWSSFLGGGEHNKGPLQTVSEGIRMGQEGAYIKEYLKKFQEQHGYSSQYAFHHTLFGGIYNPTEEFKGKPMEAEQAFQKESPEMFASIRLSGAAGSEYQNREKARLRKLVANGTSDQSRAAQRALDDQANNEGAPAAPKNEHMFKTQIEDLDAMNKRILQAAYSDQQSDPAADTAKNTGDLVSFLQGDGGIQAIVDAINDLPDSMPTAGLS